MGLRTTGRRNNVYLEVVMTSVKVKADSRRSNELEQWLVRNAGEWTKMWKVTTEKTHHGCYWVIYFKDARLASKFLLCWE